MDAVWVLMIWLLVTSIESLTYSYVVFILADPECAGKHSSEWFAAYFQFLDRLTNY